MIKAINPITGKPVPVTLDNVEYSPGFHTNLISLGIIKKRGFKADFDNLTIVSKQSGKLVAKMEEISNLFALSEADILFPAAFATTVFAATTKRSALPLVSKATAETWHRRLSHMHDQRIEKLAGIVDGIEVTKPTGQASHDDPEHCEVCQLTKAHRQVSRRAQGATFGPLGRIHFDLIQIQEAYNGDRWMTHFYIDGIRYHWAATHPQKNGCQEAVTSFVSQMRTWFNLPIRAFHYDNERSAGRVVEDFLTHCGFVIQHSISSTPKMNSFAERSGGVIIARMRSLLEDSKLPKNLWPEAA
jgi:hypothetical protein